MINKKMGFSLMLLVMGIGLAYAQNLSSQLSQLLSEKERAVSEFERTVDRIIQKDVYPNIEVDGLNSFNNSLDDLNRRYQNLYDRNYREFDNGTYDSFVDR
jgi:cupin superfamily acireductone dioxygenase involved in methionine salvage